ncbi:YjfK family protein [Tahibacter amnicola]|uniref:YjfK family protein n=1 Tax=Tahibacter amnicola TaxID=2976241 RepID=A0ABY6BG33_9GAMM|nr:YjfK family protein [Tahibacter amnicola]UXI67330.1 YjfK family protein [Tahibacter amnicola]
MSWFGKMFGSKNDEPAPAPSGPLGLRLRGAVAVDSLPFRMAGDRLVFAAPEGHQAIEAWGEVTLGGNSRLHRYYLTDDAFVQVSTTAGQIDDVKLFVFHETRNPPNQHAFNEWVRRGSLIGAQHIDVAGQRYYRVWGDTPESAWAPPVVFDEKVYGKSTTTPDYDLTHYAMLYQREVPGLERYEYLLVSAEDYGPDEYCVTFSVGVDVTQADLTIT